MSHYTLVCLLLWFGAFTKGGDAGVVEVVVGGVAFLSCDLATPADVVQVTWQKVSPALNLGTNSKYSPPRVNAAYRHRVEFHHAGLNNSAIVIRNVRRQDEGCYQCLFNVQDQGALSHQTCIHVYELNEPILRVSESPSTAEFVVSCLATGRPAPTVTLSVPEQPFRFSHNSTVTVANADGTVMVNATAVLSNLRANVTVVACSARPAFGSQKEVFTTIHGLDEEHSRSNGDDGLSWLVVFVVLLLLLLLFCVCFAAVVTFKKLQNSLCHVDPEKDEDDEEEELKATRTPSNSPPLSRMQWSSPPSTRTRVEEDDGGSVRKRGSAVKDPNADAKRKTNAAKRLMYDDDAHRRL